MNTSEAAAILRLVTAATGQPVDQYAPDAWALILDDVDPGDAKLAVRDICRRPQPRDRRLVVTPDMVLVEARRIRRERIEAADAGFEPSPATRDDPAAYVRELRDHRARAAAGELEQARPDGRALLGVAGSCGQSTVDRRADLRALGARVGAVPREERS